MLDPCVIEALLSEYERTAHEDDLDAGTASAEHRAERLALAVLFVGGSYPAMCRDGHAEVRYGYDEDGSRLRDSEDCPVCYARRGGLAMRSGGA